MSYQLLTTKEQTDQNISGFENELNQTVPENTKSFIRVLSAILAIQQTSLAKMGAERALQNLALTATGEDLDLIGKNYGVIRIAAVSSVLEAELPGTNGTNIPATTNFIGVINGLLYYPQASAVIGGGVAILNVTCQLPGVAGNLQVADELSIQTQVPGAQTVAVVTDVVTIGANGETDERYRVRILDIIRSTGGGGNSADYRRWSEGVAGVERAYPYAGRPISDVDPSEPPDRTVYIEATAEIDPDGVAPAPLLDEVRAAITTDPVTGLARQPLGLTDETLFVVSIYNTSFYVQVRGLLVDISVEVQAQQEITAAVELYFRSVRPWIAGLDPDFEKNDILSDLTIGAVVQQIVDKFGGSAEGVNFDIAPGGSTSLYTLGQGELAKCVNVEFI